jgi:hypothetical protein
VAAVARAGRIADLCLQLVLAPHGTSMSFSRVLKQSGPPIGGAKTPFLIAFGCSGSEDKVCTDAKIYAAQAPQVDEEGATAVRGQEISASRRCHFLTARSVHRQHDFLNTFDIINPLEQAEDLVLRFDASCYPVFLRSGFHDSVYSSSWISTTTPLLPSPALSPSTAACQSGEGMG